MRILHSRPRAGFTLLELLVVLVILSTLTLVAIRTTDGLQDQARYDATQRGLQEIENAVLGTSDAPGGFVADMGRLPQSASATAGLEASELWQPNAAYAYGLRTPAAPDNDIPFYCGWRGPYLRLGAGVSSLVDGWGTPYTLVPAAPPVGTAIQQFVSPGAGRSIPYDVDLAGVSLSAAFTGTVTVNVFYTQPSGPPIAAGTATEVRLFQPDGTTGVAMASGFGSSVVFPNVPVGVRAVRAYRKEAGDVIPAVGTPFDSATSKRSAPIWVTVPRNGTAVVNIYLPPPP